MANPGEVEIDLAGERLVLRPTLRAARAVSALAQGFMGAFDGLQRYNMGIYAAVISAGLGKRSSSEMAEIEEKVYAHGMETLVGPLSKYLSLLMNGGRESSDATEGAQTGKS